MKSILYVQNTPDIGGASYCLLNVIKGLDRKEYTPIVLLPELGPLSEELNSIGVKVYVLPKLRGIPYNRSLLNPKFLLSYLRVFQMLKPFKDFLRINPVDIVYLNSMVLYPLLRLSKEAGCKTIIHIREHWPLEEHKIQLAFARKFVKKYADRVFAINSYSASIFPNNKDKCNIVYDWIEMSDRYEELSYDGIFKEDVSNLKIFLYTGGFQEIKGIHEVVEVFHNHITSPNARLLILGNKPTSNSSLNISKTLDIIKQDKRIECIPPTYKIKHIIEQAYCILSFFTIPHANLNLAENIILNKITIAADTEESREYSLDGKLALLFKINDKEDFITQVKSLEKRNIEIMKNLRNNSLIVKEMFDKKRNLDVINQTYKKI